MSPDKNQATFVDKDLAALYNTSRYVNRTSSKCFGCSENKILSAYVLNNCSIIFIVSSIAFVMSV